MVFSAILVYTYTYLFKVNVKQVITTYIYHSQLLIPDGIHLISLTRFERREKPDISLYAER